MANKLNLEPTDLDILNSARHRVSYEGYKNSLVEWTLTDAWVHVKKHKHSDARGLVTKCGLIDIVTECEGEISNAH